MVKVSSWQKSDIKATPKDIVGYRVFCAMYSKTEVVGYEVIEPWLPEGCHKTELVDLEDTKGWTWQGSYALCPSCSKLWHEKFEAKYEW